MSSLEVFTTQNPPNDRESYDRSNFSTLEKMQKYLIAFVSLLSTRAHPAPFSYKCARKQHFPNRISRLQSSSAQAQLNDPTQSPHNDDDDEAGNLRLHDQVATIMALMGCFSLFLQFSNMKALENENSTLRRNIEDSLNRMNWVEQDILLLRGVIAEEKGENWWVDNVEGCVGHGDDIENEENMGGNEDDEDDDLD